MSQTGEAAEQIVNMVTNVTVKGVECVANLSGKAAVSLAAFLIAALKDEKRVSGKTRMRSFRGKPTQVFVIKQGELRAFAQEAKKYGVLYAAVVDKRNPDGLCDIVVSAEDAARVNRIADRFALSAVDVEKIREDIIKARKLAAEQTQPGQNAGGAKQPARPDPASDKPHTVSDGELSEMLGQPRPEPSNRPEPAANENPTTARRTAPPPSGRTSGSKGSTGRDIERRPSVRQAIRELQAERTAKEIHARQKQRPPHTQQHSPKKKAKQTKGR